MDRSEIIPSVGPRSPDTTCLDKWVAVHGPLWPPSALVVALETCARATRLNHVQLAAVIGSLNAAGISRNEHGWSWMPRSIEPAAQSVSDTEIIERFGGILFHSLTSGADVSVSRRARFAYDYAGAPT